MSQRQEVLESAPMARRLVPPHVQLPSHGPAPPKPAPSQTVSWWPRPPVLLLQHLALPHWGFLGFAPERVWVSDHSAGTQLR